LLTTASAATTAISTSTVTSSTTAAAAAATATSSSAAASAATATSASAATATSAAAAPAIAAATFTAIAAFATVPIVSASAPISAAASAATFVTRVVLTSGRRVGGGNGKFIFETEFFERPTTTELDAIMFVHVDHQNLHFVTDLADFVDVVDIAVRKLANVTKSIAARQNLNERSKVFDAADRSVVNFSDLYGCRARFDPFEGLLSQHRIGAGNRDAPVFVHFDNRIGIFLNLANVFAARSNQHANLVRVDLAR
jgi:hypothetical protein